MMMERDFEEKLVQRDFPLEVREVEKEDRTLEFPFSSEKGVERYFGNEVLEHKTKSANLERLNDGAPLLWNHDQEKVIGVVEKAWIDEKKRRGYAKVRFSEEEFAASKYRDVKDGILRNISFGYVIKEMEQRGEEYVATSWEGFEVSLVAIPADNSVGINRSITELQKEDKIPLDRSNDSASSDAPSIQSQPVQMNPTPKENLEERSGEFDSQKVIKAERSRIQEIQAVAEKYNLKQLGEEYIKEERTVDDFNKAVLRDWKPEAIQPNPSETNIGLTEKETRSFSVLRAIDYLADPHSRAKREAAAFEIEASEAAAAKLGRASKGITLPNEVFQRDLKTTPDTAGGNLVQTDLDAANFIDLLRNQSVIAQTGSTTLTGLQGNLSIPRQGGAGTAYWVAESASVTESNQTIEQVNMTPRSLGAMTDISRKLLLQSSIDVENMVRNDLARVIALEIDRAALYGSGASSEPLGLHNTTGIGTESITSNDPTFAQAVAMESDVAVANALTGSLAYVTRANIRGNMKVKAKDSGSGLFLWTGDDTVNGYPAYMSNQVEAGDVWFGNWSDLIVGYWSGLDLQVDPYTGGASGTVRVRVLQDVDVAVRHAASFCLGA